MLAMQQEKKGRSMAEEGTAAFRAAMANYLGHHEASPADAASLVDSLGAWLPLYA